VVVDAAVLHQPRGELVVGAAIELERLALQAHVLGRFAGKGLFVFFYVDFFGF
jgi:hypothetical protein